MCGVREVNKNKWKKKPRKQVKRERMNIRVLMQDIRSLMIILKGME